MAQIRNFMPVGPGTAVSHGGRSYRIDKVLDHATVLARDDETQAWKHLSAAELLPRIPDGGTGVPPAAPLPDLVADDAEYADAQRRLAAIEPLLADRFRSEAKVKARAKEVGIGRATLYAWLRTYEDSPQVSSLIPRKRGRPKGVNTLESDREAVIAAAIEKCHKTKRRHRVAETVKTVQLMCRNAGLTPPHANTIRDRVTALPRAETLRARGQGELARNTLQPIAGHFPGADHPLSVVQVDHSKADIILVDDETRLPIGRPWATVAIDVHTRMIAGFIVSMEAPGAFAAGQCIAQAMLPKTELLARLGVEGEWPVWGKPATVHMDNAREFRGHVLQRAFAQYGIKLQLRPVRTPHYGGHIERYMGTLGNETRNLPGATFSSPAERKGQNPERDAAMTLAEYERYIVDWIVNVYHKRVHSSLRTTPYAKWSEGIVGSPGKPGIGLQPVPADPERLRIDFLPFFERGVQRYGISIQGVTYWDDVLKLRIGEKDPETPKLKRRFVVRRDPRDISRVWFLDPGTGLHHRIATRDLTRPAVSLWEWRATQQHLRDTGASMMDEDAVFEAIERLRALAEASVLKSKSARQQRQRVANAGIAAEAAADTKLSSMAVKAGASGAGRNPRSGTAYAGAKQQNAPQGAVPPTPQPPVEAASEPLEEFDVDPMLDNFRASLGRI